MPVITARILKGRGIETKRRLASALSVAVVDVLDVPLASVTVIIEESDRENWSTGGELHCDRAEGARTDDVDLDALFRKPPEPVATKAPRGKAPAKSRPRR